MPHLIDLEIEIYRHQAVDGILHNVCVSLYMTLMCVYISLCLCLHRSVSVFTCLWRCASLCVYT